MQKTTVVNVKVKYIRPKHHNLKIWMEDPNNVYIGRKGIVFIDGERFPKESSIWANPFKITKTETRDSVVEKYREYIVQQIEEKDLHFKLEELRGKQLGCWCAPESCHGDVLLSLLEK